MKFTYIVLINGDIIRVPENANSASGAFDINLRTGVIDMFVKDAEISFANANILVPTWEIVHWRYLGEVTITNSSILYRFKR